jgi:hypothetical protein
MSSSYDVPLDFLCNRALLKEAIRSPKRRNIILFVSRKKPDRQ